MPHWRIVLILLFTALLLLPLYACDSPPGKKSLPDRWLEGIEAMSEPDPIVEVVLYFDNLWHAIAYEALAERTPTLDTDERGDSLKGMFDWFEEVKTEAKERFYDRHGFYPPDYFPPHEPHQVTDLIPDLGEVAWALHALEWEKILRRNGIGRWEDVPRHREWWQAVAQIQPPESDGHSLTLSPGTYVEFYYGRKSGGPENHGELAERLRQDPRITGEPFHASVLCIAGLDRTETESYRVEEERKGGTVELAACQKSGVILVGPLDAERAQILQHAWPASGRFLHLYAEIREVKEFRLPERPGTTQDPE